MNATAAPTAPPSEKSARRTARGALDSLTIRRRTTGEAAAARAVLMRRLRIGLPILALLLVVAFFLNARTGGDENAFLEDFADLEATTQNLSSVKPQFSGVDASGNPYEITAETANQTPERHDVVELDRPRAVTAGGDRQSVVEAQSGVFNTDDKLLLLKNGVIYEHAIGSDNYVLRSSEATVSIDEQTVVSDSGVEGEGPSGATLKADRMTADNRQGRVVFEGEVSMRLRAKQAGDAASAPEEANSDRKNGEPE